MAKKFNDIYLEAKSTVYSNQTNALIVLAKLNSQVAFTQVLKPGAVAGDVTKAPEYTVQRRKRPTVNTVANATAGSTASALAALDQFTVTDWESVEIGTGVLKSVGFKATFNDDYDFSNNPQHAKDMFYQVGEIASQRKKDLNTLLLTASKTGSALPAYSKGDTLVWDAISGTVLSLAQVDDEFMDVQGLSDFIIQVSPSVAKDLAKEMGTAFNQEAPIAQTGFTTGMSINGTPVIVEPRFTGREVIVMHRESIAFKAEAVKKDVKVNLGLVEFTGEFFYEVMAILDKERIKKIAA